MITKENLPLLLKRKHFINVIGLRNSLYYELLHSGVLPCVTIKGRQYVLRDKFFDMLENNSIPGMEVA